MIVQSIIKRTLFIKAHEYGTAFTIHFQEQEFLITARHLLDESLNNFDLKIFFNDCWHSFPATVIGHGKGEIDISVLKLEVPLTSPDFTVSPTMANLIYGQDVYFLGFPYKMWSSVGDFLNGQPLPFAKKGTLSTLGFGDPRVLYVDAINNEGFSGGPLFFYPAGDLNQVNIAGVVSKFRIEHEPVLDNQGIPTGESVPYNTGFLVAYGINHAIDIITSKHLSSR